MGWKRTTNLYPVRVEDRQEKAKEEGLILAFAKTYPLNLGSEYLPCAIAHGM
jgi:hypothetical protein